MYWPTTERERETTVPKLEAFVLNFVTNCRYYDHLHWRNKIMHIVCKVIYWTTSLLCYLIPDYANAKPDMDSVNLSYLMFYFSVLILCLPIQSSESCLDIFFINCAYALCSAYNPYFNPGYSSNNFPMCFFYAHISVLSLKTLLKQN